MLLGNLNSPANPIQGSAYSTYGYKPETAIIAFSVGDQAGDASYVTLDPAGNRPTIAIDNGILTFSQPQTHSYVGIGDIVSWPTGNEVYIVGKLSTREWIVRNGDGSVPDDVTTNPTIDSIDKSFSSLSAAVLGAAALIGDVDLVSINTALHIPCYELASPSSVAVDITGWTTSPEHYIKVFAPNSVATECNKSQRHGVTPGGFTIENSGALSTLITSTSNNVIIDGLCLSEHVSGCNVGIDMVGSGVVSNCMLKGFANDAIKVTESSDDVQVIGNVVYESGARGVSANSSSKVIANTVYGKTAGFVFTAPGASTYAANNVAANNTTDYTTPPTEFHNCCSDDATAGSSNGCVSSITTLFYDTSTFDFRLTNANDERKIRTGLDLRAVSPYYITRDAANAPNDSTPSMGALHTIPVVPAAIGDTSSNRDVGGATFEVADGLVTFSGAQTNPLLTSGCVLTHGGGSFTLLEKVSNTVWRATEDTGLAPSAVGAGTAITSIYPKFESVAVATPPAVDLVTNDTAWEIICAEATGTSDTDVEITGMTTDETRDIKIYAPVLGSKSNSWLRHRGVWNDSLMHINSIKADAQGYVSVTGVQAGADATKNAIHLENTTSRVEACIVKGADVGILVKPETNTASVISVLNNIVYDCASEGVKLESDSTETRNLFSIYNNTVYNNLYGISFDGISGGDENVIRLVNNICLMNQKDYVGDGPRSQYLSTESNWSSDASAFSYATGRNNDIFKTVHFRGLRDFHIPLAQQILMVSGYTASADHACQTCIDIDSVDRPENSGWSIGADQYSAPFVNKAFFSVGSSFGSDLQGTTPTFDIVDGIATFSEDLDASIGIGDVINSDISDMYLAEKGTSSIWLVVDELGVPVPTTSGTVTTIGRVAETIKDAVETTVPGLIGGQDLVTNTMAANIECYQDGVAGDTGDVDIAAWTTSSDYALTIESPFDTLTQCGARQRHEGVYSTSHFFVDSNGSKGFSIKSPYVFIDGLQFTDAVVNAIDFDGAADDVTGCKVERCVFSGTFAKAVCQVNATFPIRVNSNIAVDPTVYGLDLKNGAACNNTVVNDSAGSTSYTGPATVSFINCIAQGSETGFAGLAVKTSCISEDSSAGTSDGCKSSVALDFYGTGDYHLDRSDFEAINYGDITSLYLPSLDVDSSIITDFSIGAHCPTYETIDVYFSCSQSTASFVGSGLTVSIDGSVATFSSEISDNNIMVGDVVEYDVPSTYAYLLRKISGTEWEVKDAMGQTPASVSTKSVVSIKRAFNSLRNLFDVTHAGSIAQFYGDSTNPFIALDKGMMNIHISIAGGGANVDPVDIDGYTADAENHFTLFAPVEGAQANGEHKHDGTYDTFKSSLIYSSAITATEVLGLRTPYTRVEGLIISAGGTSVSSLNGIYVNAVGCQIVDNIIISCKRGIDSYLDYLYTVIANNVIYDTYDACIKTSEEDYVYNNTASKVNSAAGAVIDHESGAFLTNNIAQTTVGVCYADGVGCQNCLSSDATLATGNGNIISTILSFIAPTGPTHDFNLDKDDEARGAGIQLSADLLYAFSSDMVSKTRGRIWDMGALEYAATKTVYYSVGSSSEHRTVKSDGSLSIHIDVVDGESIGIFTEPQVSDYIMSGDTVVTDAGSILLAEKIDTSTWRVTNPSGTAVSAGTPNVSSIRRTFSTIYGIGAAILSRLGSTNLPSIEVQVNITIGKESVLIDDHANTISFTATDVDYFLKIFAPNDTSRFCNVSQRHVGMYNDGASLLFDASGFGLTITNSDFFELEGIVIRNQHRSGAGVFLNGCTKSVMNSCIVRNCQAGGVKVNVDHLSYTGRESIIVNNIVNGCGFSGLKIYGDNDNTLWIVNNTIADCATGFHHVKGETGGVTVHLYNNIFRNFNGGDIVEDNPTNTKLFAQYNITKDGSSGDTNNNINDFEISFVDSSIENFELDPDSDSFAVDSALDMQYLCPFYFDDDIRGVARETMFWDRGALERNENIGSGSMTLGPMMMQNRIGIVTDQAPTKILYIRSASTTRAPLYEQFDIDTEDSFYLGAGAKNLTDYLAWNDIDNIIIYIEGGQTFTGTFDFANRGDRTVLVTTDPTEILEKGKASFVYDPLVVVSTSVNGGVTFENLKVYSADGSTEYVIGATALTPSLTFINCIVQMNLNAVTANANCKVHSINSILMYFDKGASINTFLNYADITGQTLINSIVISETASDGLFAMDSSNLSDYINNCITKNYGGGSLDINAPASRTILCQQNIDPLFSEIESDWAISNTSDIMVQSDFKPLLTSPTVEAGVSSVVSTYDIETDIDGNDRVFEFGEIDIGPYELEVHIFDVSGSDIQSIDQVKCEIDRINRRVVSEDLVYAGLFDRFKNDYADLEEFIREENVAITLKQNESTVMLRTDKPNELLAEFEANYDAPTMTILVKKLGGDASRKLGQMLESDLYVLHFDEQQSKLSMYLNKVATLALNGSRNPIKNVQFGGNPTFSG